MGKSVYKNIPIDAVEISCEMVKVDRHEWAFQLVFTQFSIYVYY